MKFAIHDARTRTLLKDAEGPDWTCASFFFHDRGSDVQKSLTGMMQEILGSLLRQLPKLLPYIEPHFSKLAKAQRTQRPAWHLESLKSALHNIVEQRKFQIRIILFLDALDEHAGDNEELVDILKSMSAKADNDYVFLKVCLASRSWNIFKRHFSRCPGLVIHEHTRSDIQVFTDSQLQASIEDFPDLLSLKELEQLTEQIIAKALGVFIWVRLVVEQLALDIRDGTPYQILVHRISQMPQELKDLYADILRRLNPTYMNEVYVMLQIAICSLEPLPLNTFMQAVNFAMHQYPENGLDESPPEDLTSTAAFRADSEASQLRRLSSRTGGILETFVTTTEGSSADHEEPASPRLPSGEQSLDSSTSSSSFAVANAAIHTVQFLHTTAKEFIEAQRHKLLLGSVDHVITALDGHDILFLCCASPGSWVLPIFKHIFYYLKMAELHDATNFDDVRNSARYSTLETSVKRPRGVSDVKGILSPSHVGFLRDREPGVLSSTYILLILAVAANAKNLVKYILDTRFPVQGREIICLLQVAAAGPDLVPIEHQDRTGMIEILVSSGYPIDQRASLCTGLQSESPQRWTSLQVVVTRQIGSAYSEDTRLDIVKCLLDQGANVNGSLPPPPLYRMSPLSYCIQNESAALVRLLLEYKANTVFRDDYGMQPIDYVLIRQDKAILKALADHGCNRVIPDRPPSDDKAIESGVRQSMLWGIIGHPMVAVISARDLRYLYD
ncbi:MAG: hypothetical protein Q9195_008559 [Heterodermia aff. obscurata]